MNTIVTLKPYSTEQRVQWGVWDKRQNKLVRTALSRKAARSKSRMSKHYVVVSRTINVGRWDKEKLD